VSTGHAVEVSARSHCRHARRSPRPRASRPDPREFLSRHAQGDWGELDEHDRNENEFSLREGFRILSAYHLKDDTRIWIITEADRSSTTILLPEEY
jgi:hypothetical protein